MSEISSTGDQMLSVLEMVARKGPVSAADIARLCGINRTVAHRLLVTLAQRAYVRRIEAGYTIGPMVLSLAKTADTDLLSTLKPIIERLAERLGETVVIHGIDDLEAIVIDQALGQQHLVRVEHRPGTRHPLYLGASGWSLLAFQNERLIARVMRKHHAPETARQRIEKVRAAGYAISHDELQMGVHGIAVPVIEQGDRCRVSMGILVPETRAHLLSGFVEPLLSAAEEASRNLPDRPGASPAL